MKGVPQHPQCGYSNFVVEVLKYYSKTITFSFIVSQFFSFRNFRL